MTIVAKIIHAGIGLYLPLIVLEEVAHLHLKVNIGDSKL